MLVGSVGRIAKAAPVGALVGVVILGVLPGPARAQTQTPPCAQHATGPFELGAGMLAVGYCGHDLHSIVATLRKRDLAASKGEFETEKEYEQRVAARALEPLIDGVTAADRLAFRFAPPVVKSEYDADTERFRVTLVTSAVHTASAGQDDARYLAVCQEKHRHLSSYDGSNAFGATRTVLKEIGSKQCVSFPRRLKVTSGKLDVLPSGLVFELPVPRSGAPDVKLGLRVLLVGKLAEQSVGMGITSHRPTIDEPFDRGWVYEYISFLPEQVIGFNELTGDILSRASLSIKGR